MGKKKKTNEEIIEDLNKQIKTKKILPKKVQQDISSNIFRNIMLAIIIMLFFYFINLGYINIQKEAYILDLKVFAIGLMITTIVIFEKAYKKDSGKLTIHGIEILILSIVTLFAIHLYIGIPNKYVYIYTLISYIFAIYYIIKSIIIYKKKKKQYKLSSAKEITQKDNTIENQEYQKEELKENIVVEKPKKRGRPKKEDTNKKPKNKVTKETKSTSKKGKRMKEREEK